MKKICILYILVFVFGALNAQSFLGIKGGYHLSAIDFDPNIPVENRFFPEGGIIFIHSNLPYRGIQLEVNYIRKGFRVDYKNGFGFKRTYNFIEVPVLSRFYIRNQGTRIVITIGPNIGYHFDDSGVGYTSDWFYGQQHFKPANKHDYTPFKVEYGLLAGLGLFRQFENTSIQAEFRTYYGLTQFVSNDAFFDNRTFVYTLTLAYLFNL